MQKPRAQKIRTWPPLLSMYRAARKEFGHLHWWPAETPFEVIVGAILTQNTSWKNVEKAVKNLKSHGVLSAPALHGMPTEQLAGLIRSSGFFNVKARRLKAFLAFMALEYGLDTRRMARAPGGPLRARLLEVGGIGRETADSILLYALGKPFFVVDAYTRRIFSRHGLIDARWDYDRIRDYFQKTLPPHTRLWNDYHAQVVMIGKTYCAKTRPLCPQCPWNRYLAQAPRE